MKDYETLVEEKLDGFWEDIDLTLTEFKGCE